MSDDARERLLERAEAAEARLAAVRAVCREPWETCPATGADLVRVADVLAAAGEGDGDG